MKKVISVLLTTTMLLGITASVPLSVSAVTTDMVESGNTYTYTDRYGEWTYRLINNGTSCEITDFYDVDNYWTNIEIPSAINDIPVVSIDDYTFYCCYNLPEVTIPGSVTHIGEYSFANCYSLTNVTISDGVTFIGYGAFRNCDKLASVAIPSSVTYIDDCVFETCDNLTSVDVSATNNDYSSIDGVLFNKEQSEILFYPIGKASDNYIIPDSVVTIGYRAFSDSNNLTGITIPDGVTTIKSSAFSRCTKLTDITIPDGVTSIGSYAFEGCSNLNNVIIPKSVTFIGDHAFAFCDNLTDVYYTGDKNEWDNIVIDDFNDSLLNATIHHNYATQIAGDVSDNGEVAVDDVIYVLQHTVGTTTLTGTQFKAADVNNDGKVTVLDAIMIQRIILG